MKKAKKISSKDLFKWYGNHLLQQGDKPKNVFLFAKENQFDESEFYQYFSSFEALERQMMSHFFTQSLDLASKIDHFETSTPKEKLLHVYYIFFENLTLNRSLVLEILGKERTYQVKILHDLKKNHQEFVKSLALESIELFEKASEKIKDFADKSKEELLWLHLISCIEFWKKDQSPSFEKTDVYIEKTIDTGFDLIDQEPMKKLLDLGKFLWKEKFKISS